MSNKQSAKEILGSPPWSEDKLARAYSADFPGILNVLHTHPGYEIHAELDALMLSRRIFDRSITELTEAVQSFERYSITRDFRNRATRQIYENRILDVQAALFYAASGAIALKARTTTLNNRFTVAGFQPEIKHSFEDNERHQFIFYLRGHLEHVGPLSPDWHLSWSAKDSPQQTRFLLYAGDLLNIANRGHRRWHPLAIKFIERHRGNPADNFGKGGAIDILSLFTDYRADITSFYDWFRDAIEQLGGDHLRDYRESEKSFNRVVARMDWKAWALPTLEQSPAPRTILDIFLTSEDQTKINSLPNGSKEQLDEIIKSINQDNDFVDDEIRLRLTKVFGSAS